MTEQPDHIRKPNVVKIITKGLAGLLCLVGIAGLALGVYYLINPGSVVSDPSQLIQFSHFHYAVTLFLLAGFIGFVAQGLWRYRNWSRMVLLTVLIFYTLYQFILTIFAILTTIFAGLSVVPIASILRVVGLGLVYFLLNAAAPILLVIALIKIQQFFIESARQREFIEKTVRYVLLGTALSSIIIVLLIFIFTITEAWDSIQSIGLDAMLLGTILRPGSIIGTDKAQLRRFYWLKSHPNPHGRSCDRPSNYWLASHRLCTGFLAWWYWRH